MSLKDKYAIVGVGYTPQGVIPNRTALSFHVEACANAIKDAGLKREDIDGLICYRYFLPALGEAEVTPYLVAQQLGLSPKALSQQANCSRTQLLDALGWLEAGLCNYVVISYADNPHSGAPSFTYGYITRRIINNYEAVFGQCFGIARLMMGTLRMGVDIAYSWPSAQVARINPEEAVESIYKEEISLSKEPNTLRRDKLRELLKNYINYPYHALEQAMVHEIVDPRDTRPVLIRTLKNLANKEVAPRPWGKHSLVPQ